MTGWRVARYQDYPDCPGDWQEPDINDLACAAAAGEDKTSLLASKLNRAEYGHENSPSQKLGLQGLRVPPSASAVCGM